MAYLCILGVVPDAHNRPCPPDCRLPGSTRRDALQKTFLSASRRMGSSLKLRVEGAPQGEHRNTSHVGFIRELHPFTNSQTSLGLLALSAVSSAPVGTPLKGALWLIVWSHWLWNKSVLCVCCSVRQD